MKSTFVPKKPRVLFGLLSLASLFMPPVMALAGDAIHLGISDRHLDAFFDLPFAYHQVPKTNVLLSTKVQKGNAAEIDKALSTDVNGISRQVLVDSFGGKEVKDGFAISADSDGDSLSITPWVLLQFLDDGEVKEWTFGTFNFGTFTGTRKNGRAFVSRGWRTQGHSRAKGVGPPTEVHS